MSAASKLNKFFADNKMRQADLGGERLSKEEMALLEKNFGKYKFITTKRDPTDPESQYFIFSFANLNGMVGIYGYYSSYDATDYSGGEFWDAEISSITYYKAKEYKNANDLVKEMVAEGEELKLGSGDAGDGSWGSWG